MTQKNDTKEFVKELPDLLKRFKTTTIIQNEIHFGEVKGKIDWAQTTKERLARNHKDKTIFSMNESIRSYNTPENLVLKELLGILYAILFNESFIKGFENREWFSEWQELKKKIVLAYKRNIYLQRVDYVHVSDRIILKTLNHRNKLYRNSAKLLLFYRKLMNGLYSKEDIENVLRETFIAPDNVDVLFELYWIIQLIKKNTNESQLHLMDGSQNMVASWETEFYSYKLYHNSTGSNEIQFSITTDAISENSNSFLKRKYRSFTTSNLFAHEFFGRTPTKFLWRGRPDFLLEVIIRKLTKSLNLLLGKLRILQEWNTQLLG